MTRRPEDFPTADGPRGIDRPKSEVYDLGVIDLLPQEESEETFYMPFNGYIQRVGISWPSGSNNAIGAKLSVLPGLLDQQDSPSAYKYVSDLGTFFPKNYPNPEYVTDDNQFIAFRPVEYIPARAEVEAEIRNGSSTSTLDLQLRVTVVDFDPRAVTNSVQPPTNTGRRR